MAIVHAVTSVILLAIIARSCLICHLHVEALLATVIVTIVVLERGALININA